MSLFRRTRLPSPPPAAEPMPPRPPECRPPAPQVTWMGYGPVDPEFDPTGTPHPPFTGSSSSANGDET